MTVCVCLRICAPQVCLRNGKTYQKGKKKGVKVCAVCNWRFQSFHKKRQKRRFSKNMHHFLRAPVSHTFCSCLHAGIWLLYFIRSLEKRRKITVKLLTIIKHTFRNTVYSKTIRIRFTMLHQ